MGYLASFLTRPKLQENHFFIFFLILVALSFFMVFSFHPWDHFFMGDDSHFHVQRLQSLMDALRDGTFPYYIDHKALDGLGYPIKWFYPDILLVPVALLAMLTDIPFAFKAFFFILTVLCGLFMYMLSKRIFKSNYGAYISSIAYTFSVYRMQDLFERMALGEAVSFTFLPVVFLGLYEIIKGDYRKWYIITIGYSLMIFNHVLSSFMMFVIMLVILIIYCKPLIKEKKRISYLLLAGMLTICLTAYFVFPMIEQLLDNSFYFTSHKQINIAYSVSPLYIVLWGLGGSFYYPNPYEVFVPSIGLLPVVLACFRLLILKQKSKLLRFADICVLIGLGCIISCTQIFPWKVFPFTLLDVIQFPWRFYEFCTFFFTLSGGYYLLLVLKKPKARLWGIVLVVAASIWVIWLDSYILHNKYNNAMNRSDDLKVASEADIKYGLGLLEYIPSQVPSFDYLDERIGKTIPENEGIKMDNYSKQNSVIRFDLEVQQQGKVELPLLYYKGYSAAVDEIPVAVERSNTGFVELSVANSGKATVEYTGTFIQRLGVLISIISLILFIIYLLKLKKRAKSV